MEDKSFCVYILFSIKINRYYVGTTDDVSNRLLEHNSGLQKGSFTSRGLPSIVFLLIENLKSEQAYKIEDHIKAMKSKKYILNLKRYPELVEKLKSRFI